MEFAGTELRLSISKNTEQKTRLLNLEVVIDLEHLMSTIHLSMKRHSHLSCYGLYISLNINTSLKRHLIRAGI